MLPGAASIEKRSPATSIPNDSPSTPRSRPLVDEKQLERSEKSSATRTPRPKRKRDDPRFVRWEEKEYESKMKSTARSIWVEVQTRWVVMRPILKSKATASKDRGSQKAIKRFKLEMSMATEEADDMGRMTIESSAMLMRLWESLRTICENEKQWMALRDQLTQLGKYIGILDCIAEYPST